MSPGIKVEARTQIVADLARYFRERGETDLETMLGIAFDSGWVNGGAHARREIHNHYQKLGVQ